MHQERGREVGGCNFDQVKLHPQAQQNIKTLRWKPATYFS
jgi:hypothetical protein